MTTSYTLTGDLASILGGGVRAPRVVATLGTNLGDQPLVDLDANEVRLPGPVRLTLTDELTFSVSLIATNSTGTNVTDGTLRYIITAEYVDALGRQRTWSSGYFDLTADADLSDKLATAVSGAPVPTFTEAALVSFAPTGTVGATNVQAAIAEVASEAESGLAGKVDRARVSFNAKNFGAVGDGVADDTTALLAWLDAMIAVGGRAAGYLPAGIYRITAPLKRRGTGVSLTIRGEGGRQSYLFGDFVGAGEGCLDLSNEPAPAASTPGHRISGLGFLGRGTPGDPVGLLLLNAYEHIVDDIDAPAGIHVGGNGGKPLANSVIICTNDNNSKFNNIRSQGGWQPKAFDTAGATCSVSGTTVTASAAVFTSAHVGRTIYFASGSDTGNHAIWSGVIASLTSSTVVELTAAAPTAVAAGTRFEIGQGGSGANITGSLTNGSNQLVLANIHDLSSAYVGMQVHAQNASIKTDAGNSLGYLSTTITAVDVATKTLTLAAPATNTVSATELLFAPTLFIGSFEGDPQGRQTNHSWWTNVHMEGFACAGLIVNRAIYLMFDNLKLHGAAYSYADDWGQCVRPAVFSEVKSVVAKGIQAAYGISGWKIHVSGSRGILVLDDLETAHLFKDVAPIRVASADTECRVVIGNALFTYPIDPSANFSATFNPYFAANPWSIESFGSSTHRAKALSWSKTPPRVMPAITGQHVRLDIADDAVVQIPTYGNHGTIRIATNAAGCWANINYRTSGDSNGFLFEVQNAGGNVEVLAVASTPIAGTGGDGTDGKFVVAMGTDNIIRIKNRRGFAVRTSAIIAPFGF